MFEFIERHNLQGSVHDKVVHLMELDAKRSVALLIQYWSMISSFEVVSQLLDAKNVDNRKYLIYLYLHSLFEVDPNAGRNFHDLQVELYAEYEPRMLLPFLRSSQHYKLDKVNLPDCIKLKPCAHCVQKLIGIHDDHRRMKYAPEKNLLREQVFILGRMGNSKQALSVLIDKLEDMEEAMEFVSLQNDNELGEEFIKQSLSKPEMAWR